jgi:hypothetical protein
MGIETSTSTDLQGIVCPKCGYRQEASFECHRCGIVFHKYRERDRTSPAQAAPREKAIEPEPSASRHLFTGKAILALSLMALAMFLLLRAYMHRPIVHGPGIIAPRIPKQVNLPQTMPFRYKDYVITPLATFDIEARVLGIKRYRFDRESDLVPYDVVLGWGKMSDEAVLNEITITQSNRFYHWWTRRLPMPRRAIEVNSANMHLIPADRTIAKRLSGLRKGHVIAIKGFLVRADTNNWHWMSSLTRQDTGAGACELIWVVNVAVR